MNILSIVHQHHKPYSELEKEFMYRQKNLIPFDYEFLMLFGQAALEVGRLRKALEATRGALVHTQDPVRRALAYLALSRIYRMMMYMDNARTELEHAYGTLRVPYPKTTFVFLLTSLRALFITLPNQGVDYHDNEKVIHRRKVLVALHEETALLSYHFRDSPFLVLLLLLHTRIIVSKIGTSFEMVNYLGATATFFAMSQHHRLSNYYSKQSLATAEKLPYAYPLVKYKLWQALSLDYLCNPEASAALFESLLKENKKELTPHDIVALGTALTGNYTLRGQTEKALMSAGNIVFPHGRTTNSLFSTNTMYVEWHRIPALSFYGKHEEIAKILAHSKVIFSSAPKEKWHVSQYLGNLLMSHYFSKQHDIQEIKNVTDRFDVLTLSPQETPLEASHYWVTKAYLYVDLFHQQVIGFKDLKKSITALKAIADHPAVGAHYNILQAHLALLSNSFLFAKKYIDRAKVLTSQVDNKWADYEIRRLLVRLYIKEGMYKDAEVTLATILEIIEKHEWKGCHTQYEKLKALFP